MGNHSQTQAANLDASTHNRENKNEVRKMKDIPQSEAEWKKILTPEEFHILREKGTERPFSGKYNFEKRDGTYHCSACGAKLFSSKTKYDSGSGWPSFYKAIENGAILEKIDKSHGMVRTEIMCSRCGSHLGHVFNDGPEPTGLRYCVNSLSLKLAPLPKEKKP